MHHHHYYCRVELNKFTLTIKSKKLKLITVSSQFLQQMWQVWWWRYDEVVGKEITYTLLLSDGDHHSVDEGTACSQTSFKVAIINPNEEDLVFFSGLYIWKEQLHLALTEISLWGRTFTKFVAIFLVLQRWKSWNAFILIGKLKIGQRWVCMCLCLCTYFHIGCIKKTAMGSKTYVLLINLRF